MMTMLKSCRLKSRRKLKEQGSRPATGLSQRLGIRMPHQQSLPATISIKYSGLRARWKLSLKGIQMRAWM
eukprot:6994891-Karenia_brevis.AAC.1